LQGSASVPSIQRTIDARPRSWCRRAGHLAWT